MRRGNRRVVCLLGSPRPKGNTFDMLAALMRGAEEAGAEAVLHRLNELEYRGCQGCLSCKRKSETCVLRDGLSAVLEDVRGCDALVLGTPVYFGEVTAQLKGFIDRTFCYLKPGYAHLPRGERSRLAPGKDLAFVIAQGHPKEDLFTDIFPRYEYFYRWLGFGHSRLLRACGVYDPGAAAAREEIMEQARRLGRELATGLAPGLAAGE